MRTRNNDLLSVAPVSMSFLAINAILFVYCSMQSGQFMQINSEVLTALGMGMRERVWEGEWARLFMPMFLHAGIIHIGMNGFMLYRYGPAAEVHFGSTNFATIYLLAGVGGNAFSQLFGGYHSIGASTSLFGIIGAEFAITVLRAPVLKYAWRSSVVRNEAYAICVYLAMGLTRMMGPVDNWGHLGGLVLGLILGAFFEQWRRQQRFGLPVVLAVVTAIALMVCAARWTVYSPYYHLHMAALADEAGDHADSEREFQAAQKWAGVWGSTPTVNKLILAYKQKVWTADIAREYSYKYLADHVRAVVSNDVGN